MWVCISSSKAPICRSCWPEIPDSCPLVQVPWAGGWRKSARNTVCLSLRPRRPPVPGADISTKFLPRQRLKTHSTSEREGPEAQSSSSPFYRRGVEAGAPRVACPNSLEVAQSTRALAGLSPCSGPWDPAMQEAQEGW